MKLVVSIAVLSLSLSACDITSNSPTDTNPQDSGSSADVTLDSSPDTGVVEAGYDGPYHSCVSSFNQPLTTGSAEAIQCLLQHYCVDSSGVTTAAYLIDSCHGNLPCQMGS